MSTTPNQPDDLMNHFQGRGLKTIIVFTIIAHVVVILLLSIPFLLGKFMPAEKLSEAERIKLAVQEANETLAKIAESHGLQTQQLRSQMTAGKRPSPPPADNDEPDQPASGDGETTPPAEGEIRGDSDIEKQLQEKLDPPTDLPPVDNTDDLFK